MIALLLVSLTLNWSAKCAGNNCILDATRSTGTASSWVWSLHHGKDSTVIATSQIAGNVLLPYGVDTIRVHAKDAATGKWYFKTGYVTVKPLVAQAPPRVDTLRIVRVDTVRIASKPDTVRIQLPPRVDTLRITLPVKHDTIRVQLDAPLLTTWYNAKLYSTVEDSLGVHVWRLQYLGYVEARERRTKWRICPIPDLTKVLNGTSCVPPIVPKDSGVKLLKLQPVGP